MVDIYSRLSKRELKEENDRLLSVIKFVCGERDDARADLAEARRLLAVSEARLAKAEAALEEAK